jgi:soluble lytic murein transglycosylase-like protein
MGGESRGGGVAVALLVAAYWLVPSGDSPARYHVARMLGARPIPTRQIIEREIDRVAGEFGLERSLFRALIRVESGGNPKALSPVGARGITQVMPYNHKRCGLRNAETLWDVTANLRCGAQILREEIDEHRDIGKALQAYNGGPRCINKCKESIQYAAKIIAITKKGA